MSTNTITIRRVYGEHDNEPLTVEPGEDTGCVRVVASGEPASDYWGGHRLHDEPGNGSRAGRSPDRLR